MFVKDPNDICADKFGDMELNRSTCDPEIRFKKKYVEIEKINDKHVGKEIRIRGRLHNTRQKGKSSFMEMRSKYYKI